jgi:putative ABC transport system substrate-binding protein
MVLSSVDSPLGSEGRRAIMAMAACLPASSWPLRALAQAPSKPKQVVVVYNNLRLAELAGPEPAHPDARAIVRALRDLGWIVGRNVAIRFLSAEGRFERLPSLLAQVVKSGTDVIVVYGGAADVAKEATDTIPIVAVVPDTESKRFTFGPEQPLRNVTAVTTDHGALMPKRLELLKAIAPQSANIAILTNEERAGFEAVEIEAAARTLGLTLAWIKVAGPDDLEAKLMHTLEQKVDAIAVDDTQVNFARRRTIAEFALQHRLPTITAFHEFVEAGCLLAYQSNTEEQGRRIAGYVDKILKGAMPADLPVIRPTVLDLTVNTATAKALGLVIPPAFRLLITRTIE